MICIRKQERYRRHPLPALQEMMYGSDCTGNLKTDRHSDPDRAGTGSGGHLQRAVCAGAVPGRGKLL